MNYLSAIKIPDIQLFQTLRNRLQYKLHPPVSKFLPRRLQKYFFSRVTSIRLSFIYKYIKSTFVSTSFTGFYFSVLSFPDFGLFTCSLLKSPSQPLVIMYIIKIIDANRTIVITYLITKILYSI